MQELAQQLADDWGYSTPEELAEDYVLDGVAPAICKNSGCGYSTEYEPDQDRGYCENCNTNTVTSVFVLLGVI